MSSGLRESRRFARRRRRRRVLKYAFILVALGGLGLVSFESGRGLSTVQLHQAREEIDSLSRAKAALEQQNTELRTAAQTAKLREAQLQQRYDKDVPKGERQALLALVDEQLGKGAKADRLRFLIAAASHQEKCDGKPVTKRFIVRTPLYSGANAVVTFADDALTVTAAGESAADAQGKAQAWFDPAKPIVLEIAQLGEQPRQVSGMLPLHHAVIVNGAEYRMNVVAGETRGFVKVTADRCQFP